MCVLGLFVFWIFFVCLGFVQDKRDEILEQRQQLPIFKARKEILAEFSKHDTLVLVGETGVCVSVR